MTNDEKLPKADDLGDSPDPSSLHERLHQQELLAHLGVRALSAPDLGVVFDSAVDCLRSGLGVEFAKVLRLTPERDSVRLVSGKGWIEALVGDGFVPIGIDSQAGYTLISEEPVIVDDLRTEERFDGPALLRNHGIVSGISCIIGPVSDPWGVMGAHTGQRRNFNRHDANFVAGVANIIAQAVASSASEAHAIEQELRLDLALEAAGLDLLQIEFPTGDLTLQPGDTPVGIRRGETARDFFDSIHPDDQQVIRDAFRQHVEGYEEFFAATYRVRDGQWVETRGRVVSWNGDEPLRFVGVHRDVTEQVERRERERQLETELQHAQKMEAVGRLAGGVAHDFNNILTAISGYVELLLERTDADSELAQDILEIQDAAVRARELTQQLLAFSRKENHRPQKTVVDDRLEHYRRLLSKVLGKGVELHFDLQAPSGAILIDPGQLEQLVLNLAGNARDAMSGSGTFTIRTRLCDTDELSESSPQLEVTFTDTGSGMDGEIVDKIFEPFFTTKNGEEGTGLGLALVYRVVERSNGSVDVDSAKGLGTTFRFRWPLSCDESDRKIDRNRARAVGGHEKILLVEDDRKIRSLAQRVLERSGYRVFAAPDPAEAWKIALSKGPFDIVVSDVVMPGESGPEFVSRLREEFDGFRVLYVSGYNENESLDEDTERDDVFFLPKPFTPTQLLAEIRRALS